MKKLTSYLQTRINKNALVATTVSINIILIAISRFTYIIVDKFFDQEGNFFGFKWLSTFFWNTGVEIFTINIGFVIFYSTLFMREDVRKQFRVLAFFLVSVGFFFLSWILFDDTGITNTLEIVFSIAVGVPMAKLAMDTYKFLIAWMKGLEVSLKNCLDLLINGIPEKYLDAKTTERYDDETLSPLIKKVADEF